MTSPNRGFTSTTVRVSVTCLMVVVWYFALSAQNPARSDATVDWIMVKALTRGLSPFQDARLLGQELGVPYISTLVDTQIGVGYWTPGGFLVYSPLLLAEWNLAHVLVGIVGLVSLAWMMLFLIPRYCRRPVETLLIPLKLVSLSPEFFESVAWGSVLALIAALTTVGPTRPEASGSDPPLAVPIVLKLYPGLLSVLLALRKAGRRAFWPLSERRQLFHWRVPRVWLEPDYERQAPSIRTPTLVGV